jgi:hypothetical protein
MRVKYLILWVIFGIGNGVLEGRSLGLGRHRHRRGIVSTPEGKKVKVYLKRGSL